MTIAGILLTASVMAKPNFVVIFCDDLGYGDLRSYGNRQRHTPNLDRLAKKGVRFTQFYAASPGCSPSRAALLTGCYPNRVSVPQVLNPDSPTGLNPAETNIASMLKGQGYRTSCVGKWHLGVKNLMPTNQGFDEYFGLPYSNDMWPPNGSHWPRLFLHQGTEPVEEVTNLEDQAKLTQRYTDKAVDFIQRSKDKPFFLYLAHAMPHVPIAASPKFRGKTGFGLYADTVAELDHSVGEVLAALKQTKLDRKTVVVFTSDNGPWLPYGEHAGSSGGLREGKGTSFEGGFRVPAIFSYPGRWAQGVDSDQVATTMDLLPTFAALSGASLPKNEIDGKSIDALLTRPTEEKSPWRYFFYFWPGELQAVRMGPWKLHVKHKHRFQTQPAGKGGKPAGEVTREIDGSLFNLEEDPAESVNVADKHPNVVARMMRLIEQGRGEYGDTLTGTKGSGVRPAGRVE